MVTVLEEAMDYADGIKSVIEMTLDTYEGVPGLTGVLYLLDQNMETLINLLAIVEAGDDMEEASVDRESTAEASENEINQDNSITYQELMSKQFDKSEGLHEPEPIPGALDALDEVVESAPKIDLASVHALRMQGKTAQEIADSFGVSKSTAYKWLDKIKKTRPGWADKWREAQRSDK